MKRTKRKQLFIEENSEMEMEVGVNGVIINALEDLKTEYVKGGNKVGLNY